MNQGSGRMSIIPACVFDDTRVGASAQRMLGVLGTYADSKTGMCRPDQRTLATRLGVSRQAVSKALRDLAKAGYIDIIERYSEHSGARLASHYRLIMNVQVPADCRRTPQSEVDPPQLQIAAPATWRSTPRNVAYTPPQSDVASIKEERPIENDPDRTTTTHTSVPEVVVVAGAQRATAATLDQATILRGLSDEAREVVDWWRQCHGKKRPPTLNPTQARLLEEAVADLGLERLKESVHYMAGKGVSEIDKARTAAYTKRDRDEEDDASKNGHAPPPPGPTSKLTPATDDDRAIWARALEEMRPTMNDRNFESYIEPLGVAGRGADGGLRLTVNPLMASHLARFKTRIVSALNDAGDPSPTAVTLAARRQQENGHGE